MYVLFAKIQRIYKRTVQHEYKIVQYKVMSADFFYTHFISLLLIIHARLSAFSKQKLPVV